MNLHPGLVCADIFNLRHIDKYTVVSMTQHDYILKQVIQLETKITCTVATQLEKHGSLWWIFSEINPVCEGQPLSHPAEDIGTMGFLFTVRRDWPGERFTGQIAVTVKAPRRINTPRSTERSETSSSEVTRSSHKSCFVCVCCHREKETWSAGEFFKIFLLDNVLCKPVAGSAFIRTSDLV